MRRQPLTQQRKAAIDQVSKLARSYMEQTTINQDTDSPIFDQYKTTFDIKNEEIVLSLQNLITRSKTSLLDGTANLKSLYDKALQLDSHWVKDSFFSLRSHVEPNGPVGKMVMMLCEACDQNSQQYCRVTPPAPVVSRTEFKFSEELESRLQDILNEPEENTNKPEARPQQLTEQQQQREAVINRVSQLADNYMGLKTKEKFNRILSGTTYETSETVNDKVQVEKRSVVSHLQIFINQNRPALLAGTADLKSLYDEALKSDSRKVRTGFLRLGKVHHEEPNGRVGKMVMMLCEACDPDSRNYCRAPAGRAAMEASASALSRAPNPRAPRSEESTPSNGPRR